MGNRVQKQEELARFKKTELYVDIVEAIKQHRKDLTLSLLHAASRSHDPEVRAIARAIQVDTTFEREIRGLNEPPKVLRGSVILNRVHNESREYRDYNDLLDINVGEEWSEE